MFAMPCLGLSVPDCSFTVVHISLQQFTCGVTSEGFFFLQKILRTFCGYLPNFVLLRQESVWILCGNFADICRNVQTHFGNDPFPK